MYVVEKKEYFRTLFYKASREEPPFTGLYYSKRKEVIRHFSDNTEFIQYDDLLDIFTQKYNRGIFGENENNREIFQKISHIDARTISTADLNIASPLDIFQKSAEEYVFKSSAHFHESFSDRKFTTYQFLLDYKNIDIHFLCIVKNIGPLKISTEMVVYLNNDVISKFSFSRVFGQANESPIRGRHVGKTEFERMLKKIDAICEYVEQTPMQ